MEDNIDYIHNDKTCSTLQELLDLLCDEYKLDRISIRRVYYANCSRGKFLSNEMIIELNRALSEYDDYYIKAIYHEFRHYWQLKKYPAVYNWWLRDNGDFYEELTKMKNEKGKQLSHILCELELDAELFGNTCGKSNREDLLKNFNIETADICEYKRKAENLVSEN